MNTESKVGVAAPSLYPFPGLGFQGLPLVFWEKLIDVLGYDQVEWTPMRTVVDLQIKQGVSFSQFQLIGSAEQSFRSERNLRESWRHENRMYALAAFGLFPYRTDSLRSLIQLQRLKSDIPVTLYAAQDENEIRLHEQLRNKLTQPSPDIVEHWGITSFEDMLEQFDQRGYGINLDPVHYFRLAEYFDLPEISNAVEMMGPRIQELQFGANRFDFGKKDGSEMQKRTYAATVQAYKDLMEGSKESEHTQLLLQALRSGFSGPIVSEVKVPLSLGRSVLLHRQIAKQLKVWRGVR